jgi:hypothetical protein
MVSAHDEGGDMAVMTVLEVDERDIPGNGGKVVWTLAENGHRIIITGPDGKELGSLTTGDGAIATDAFYHTFAHPDVPDVFA